MADALGATLPGTCVASIDIPPTTRLTLALYCGASGDHNPMHVDSDFARRAGAADVFVHGMLVMAYVGRLLTMIARPEQLRSFSVRFVSVTQVCEALKCAATLVSREVMADTEVLTLEVIARAQSGEVRVRGQATVAL